MSKMIRPEVVYVVMLYGAIVNGKPDCRVFTDYDSAVAIQKAIGNSAILLGPIALEWPR